MQPEQPEELSEPDADLREGEAYWQPALLPGFDWVPVAVAYRERDPDWHADREPDALADAIARADADADEFALALSIAKRIAISLAQREPDREPD